MKLAKREKREAGLEPVFGGALWQMDRLHDLLTTPMAAMRSMDEWIPPMDVLEEKDTVIITAELPGMKKEEIRVSVSGAVLRITGERKAETKHKNAESYRAERYYGRFERSLALPTPVEGDKVQAEYKDGILTITCPKTEQSKRKLIDVKIA